jgi:hypothetical protein
MTTTVGDRLHLPAPDLDEAPDGPSAFTALINALNPQPAIDLQGVLSSRPASTPATPGVRGRLYAVIGDPDDSQNGIVWRDYGTGWIAIGNFAAAVSLPGDLTPPTIATNQNDYNPSGLSSASTLRLAASAAVQITGLAGGADGRLMIVHNVGTVPIAFVREAAASTTANRFLFGFTLGPDYSMMLRFDAVSSRWRCIARHTSSELAYAEITASVTLSTSPPETVIVTAPTIILDGSQRVRVEFFCSRLGGTNMSSNVSVFDSFNGAAAANIGVIISEQHANANADSTAGYGIYAFTPGAGTHQFSIRGQTNGTAAATVLAGPGGSGVYVPAFISVTQR